MVTLDFEQEIKKKIISLILTIIVAYVRKKQFQT